MSIATKSDPSEAIVLNWKKDLEFEATTESGTLLFDSSPEHGGSGSAISPFDAFLSAAAACSAIDVASILNKKRQNLESYRVEVEWDRVTEGDWPHPVVRIRMNHIVRGAGIDELAVKQAVQLSDSKYCTVIASLRAAPEVISSYRIES